MSNTPSEGVRLNKHMADSGLCSRREADRLITEGKVTVNGTRVTEMGVRIHPATDRIQVNGHDLPSEQKRYLLFHKPKGYITTRFDEKGRPTIYDLLPEFLHNSDPAGRLDKDSTGALILSNDGDFIYRLTHPKFHLPKVYRVTLDKPLTEKDAQTLLDGVPLSPEGVVAKVEALTVETPTTLTMTLITGYNRQIRRSLEAVGYQVKTLKRLSFGPVRLGDLKPGKTRPLTPPEMRGLTPKPPSRRRKP